jgi:hypothetical protein
MQAQPQVVSTKGCHGAILKTCHGHLSLEELHFPAHRHPRNALPDTDLE